MKRQFNPIDKNKGTFIVKVEEGQRGTWQGKVIWADEDTSEHFRSALELMQLIDEALDAARANRQDAQQGSA